MADNYEFRHQSSRQKAILYLVKALVLVLLSFAIYTLVSDANHSTGSELRSIASIYAAFWIYANLLHVKVEIQELFVPPFDIRHGLEFLIIATPLYLISYFV